MAVMKSKSLEKQEQQEQQERQEQEQQGQKEKSAANFPLSIETAITEAGPILVREVPCCNDFVAVLQFHYESGAIELPEESSLKPEGLIVGVGPGIAQGGSRAESQLSLGDVVMFMPKSVSATIDSKSGPYAGRTVRILSEKAILCKLQPVPFSVID